MSDENRGPGLLVVGWLEFAIATVLLSARIYTRVWIKRSSGWDDWTMVISWLLSVTTTIIVTLGVYYGVGRHVTYLMQIHRAADLVKALQMTWLAAPFSTFSAGMGKTSVALLLMRLLHPAFMRNLLLWFIILSLFMVNLLLTIIIFAQCTPASFLWNRLNPEVEGRCWNPNIQSRLGIFQGAYSAFTDIVLALVPVLALWTLQIRMRLKVAIVAVLSLGFVAGAAAIVKTAKLPELSAADFTWTPVTLTYWYQTENWLIIIAGCIPTLKPFIAELSVMYRSSRNRFSAGPMRLSDTPEQLGGVESKGKRGAEDCRREDHMLETIGSGGKRNRYERGKYLDGSEDLELGSFGTDST